MRTAEARVLVSLMLRNAAKGPFMASMQPRQSPQISWHSICSGRHQWQAQAVEGREGAGKEGGHAGDWSGAGTSQSTLLHQPPGSPSPAALPLPGSPAG